MFLYIVIAFCILIIISLSAFISQNAKKFDYTQSILTNNEENFYKQLANALKDTDKVGSVPNVKSYLKKINKAYKMIEQKIKLSQELSSAETWLYQNYTTIVFNVKQSDYKLFATLPHKGDARVIIVANSIVSHCGCNIDNDTVKKIIDDFCSYTPLSFSEICALNGAIQVALLKKIADVSKRLVKLNRAKQKAEDDKEPDLRWAKREGYLYYFKSSGKNIPSKFIAKNNDINIQNLDYSYASTLADYSSVISNAILSLKKMREQNSLEFVVKLSPLNAYLEKDESYKNQDLNSKAHYLSAINKLADLFNAGEFSIAKACFELADKFELHFGQILFDHRYDLRKYIKGQHIVCLKNNSHKFDKSIYIGLTTALQIVFSVVASVFLPTLTLKITTFALSFFAVFPLSKFISERFLSYFLPKRPVPRMNYMQVPDNAKTDVVISHYLTDGNDAKIAIDNAVALLSVNKDKNIRFCILADLAPSKEELSEKDSIIIDSIKEYYNGLDKEVAKNFAVFVRKKVKSGKLYRAYERKRGAIADYNEMILTGNTNKFSLVLSNGGFVPVYAILLDADNVISPGEVKNAVNTIIHPLNCNYDLLAFKCSNSLMSIKTRYSKKFLADAGEQSYCNYDDFFFNLCSKSVFCGKGIYNIKSFSQKTSAVLPSGKVLSHDIIEGAIVNTGSLGLVTLENAPQSFVSDVARYNRWQRGDLLLLPFVSQKYCKDNIYSYIILSNVLCHFAPIFNFTLWVLAFAYGYVLQFIALFFTTFAVQTALLASDLAKSDKLPAGYLVKNVFLNIGRSLQEFLSLPFKAVNNLLVALKTLADYVFKPDNLLNWTTFAQGQKIKGFNKYIAVCFPSVAVVSIIGIAFGNNIALYLYALLHIAYVVYLYVVDLPQRKTKINSIDKAQLSEYAKSTYRYFDEMKDDGLICDNFQSYPYKGKSPTTSPTNLGFDLLSDVCAYKLGFIDIDSANKNILQKLNKIQDLKKWNGHLYNWYDCKSMQPVNPYFISSVDSGNFVSALIVVEQFAISHKLNDIATVAHQLIIQTDFSKLKDGERQKLSNGYNIGTQKFEGHYDMLASEARLACFIASAFSSDNSVWKNLSRNIIKAKKPTLTSWSGTTFEYLMPQIFLPDIKYSLITQSVKNAVKTFKSKKCNGLWGISECGYYEFDKDLNYKYFAYGISDLAMRNLPDKCIIAPYASALALKYDIKSVLKNLISLKEKSVFDKYGFFEAIDFRQSSKIVNSHMSHHQGMILCAITNLLHDNYIAKLFCNNDTVKGGLVMLDEPMPVYKYAKSKKQDFVYEQKTKQYCKYIKPQNFATVNLMYGNDYAVCIDDYGCGYSFSQGKNIDKFSNDIYTPEGGFGYFECEGELFSPTYAPLKKDKESFNIRFSNDNAVFYNNKYGCSMKLFLPTVIRGEIREFNVVNNSKKTKDYNFYYAQNIALAHKNEVDAHPAFADLFVSTSFDGDNNTVFAHRKAREKAGDFYVSLTVLHSEKIQVQTNRENLLGRNNGFNNPDFIFDSQNAPSIGDVLYPCFGIKTSFSLKPGESKKIAVVIQCADSMQELQNRLQQTKKKDFLQYAYQSVKLTGTNALSKYLSNEGLADYACILASKLLYEPYGRQAILSKINMYNIPSKIATHGNKLIVYNYNSDAKLTEKIVKSVIACRLVGIDCHLSIIYEENDTYGNTQVNLIKEQCKISDLENLGFVSLVNKNNYSKKDLSAYVSTAFIDATNKVILPKLYEVKPVATQKDDVVFEDCIDDVLLKSGAGGFDDNGDYIVTQKPLLPYSNIICGEKGGMIITENGGGFFYSDNSYKNKLTVWNNDPIADKPSQFMYACNGKKTIRLNKLNKGGYVKHAKGRTSFACTADSVEYRLDYGVAEQGKIKTIILEVYNKSNCDKNIDLYYYLIPCLDSKESRHNVICTKYDESTAYAVNAKTGYQMYLLSKEGGEVVCDMSQVACRESNLFTVSCNQSQFNNPVCGIALSTLISSNCVKTFEFAICDDRESLARAKNGNLKTMSETTVEEYKNANKFSLITQDRTLNILFDNLLYQVQCSRLYARAGFYQAGGAIGFRDQLQDCLAMLYNDPESVKKHILLCAQRQYIQGDVMHWWHSPCYGVRTKITDDRLFLPYLVNEYIKATGDKSILEEKVSYLVSQPLDNLQEARLEVPQKTDGKESLLLHMQRAIDSVLEYGKHGLLLVWGGDWNDALNDIGMNGEGESVWLSMFAVKVIEDFCKYIDSESVEKYRKIARDLKNAVSDTFEGGYFPRAFTDDNMWLGKPHCNVCAIDLLCQSWSVIADIGGRERQNSAIDNATQLVDDEYGIIKLLAPAFDKKNYFGYISSYPQGVRENGGQYTHASVWYLMACCMLEKCELSNKLLDYLNPLKRCSDARLNKLYKGEPYVLAGDIYSNKDNIAHCGWTWYTGSASWLYKVILEYVFGVSLSGDKLTFKKPIYKYADTSQLTYKYKSQTYKISFRQSEQNGIRINGVNYLGINYIQLKDEGKTVELCVLYK